MAKQQAIQSVFAERLAAFKDEFVQKVAALRRPVYGNVDVTQMEQRRQFWQVAEDWTPEKEAQLLLGGMSPQQVGLLKYPYRELVAKADGRASDERKMAEWVKKMAEMGAPEPEPLEALAVQAQPIEQPTPAVAGPQAPPLMGVGDAAPAPAMALPTAALPQGV